MIFGMHPPLTITLIINNKIWSLPLYMGRAGLGGECPSPKTIKTHEHIFPYIHLVLGMLFTYHFVNSRVRGQGKNFLVTFILIFILLTPPTHPMETPGDATVICTFFLFQLSAVLYLFGTIILSASQKSWI